MNRFFPNPFSDNEAKTNLDKAVSSSEYGDYATTLFIIANDCAINVSVFLASCF